MSVKIASEFLLELPHRVVGKSLQVAVREYEERDKVAVEELERQCEVGQQEKGKASLVTDLMGDPLCRARNLPLHIMLVFLIISSLISLQPNQHCLYFINY